MPPAQSRLGPRRPPRDEHRRPRWTVSALAVLPMLVLMTSMAVSTGTAAASIGASRLAKDSHFVGTLTVSEHLVWNFSGTALAEHGQRNITGHVKLELVVSGSRVVSAKASGVAVSGSMHLVEQIHPSSCDITTTHKLDSKGTFVASGSLGNLALSWPMVDHQVDVGACPGEPKGTNDFHVRWGSGAQTGLNTGACTTKDTGAKGTVVYDSTYKIGGIIDSTTNTCKGELKKTASPSTKASQQFLAAATASKAAYLTWRAAIKGKTTVRQAIGPCDTYATALTKFDTAILPIAVTGKTETDIHTLVADDRVVIKDLEAVKTETVAEIKKDAAQLIATGEKAISAGDVVRSDLGLPPS